MLNICVNSQTSPIRLLKDFSSQDGLLKVSIEDLNEGNDFSFNAGGVTRMVHPMIGYGIQNEQFSNVDWITLSGNLDYEIDMNGYLLHGISIPDKVRRKYALFKEAIWEKMHGREAAFSRSGFRAYMEYNRKEADKIRELNFSREFDLIYIHDFQQLPQAKLLGDFAPQLFRWHIPLRAEFCNDLMRDILSGFLRKYTAVVVSTQQYADELRKIGFAGPLIQSYPYIDENAIGWQSGWNDNMISEFREKWGISEDDKVILCVARRTPSKNQGIVIRAMKSVIKRYPKAKLLLVGNGSFSNSPTGGLGLSKSEKWTLHLRSLISSMGLNDNIIMTGYLDRHDVQIAYRTSDMLVLPSILEGFGLVVIEAWFHKKPVVVSSGAGVAERVVEGENGYVFNPRKPRELADKIESILARPALAEQMGENGYYVALEHTLRAGLQNELALIQEAIGLWQTKRAFDTIIDFAET